jgi:hypothetical protein
VQYAECSHFIGRERKGEGLAAAGHSRMQRAPKKWGGGGFLQSAFYTRIQLRQNAAGLANAKDRTGSFPSSKLQFYPPAY